MIDEEECGRRLRAAREEAGLTQTEAAARLGWAIPSYTQYERGKRVPSWVTLAKMVEALGLDPETLFPEWVAPKAAPKKKGAPKR
jgi:transcriptional regulator with XRE-family HTH domain